MVEIIEQEEEKMRISAAVLASLPEWFGIPESTAVYVQECREYMQRLYHFEGNQPLYRGNICNGRAKRIPSNGDWS